MKKYTILDSAGQKKIVYAPNMKKALRYVGDIEDSVKDSKVRDEDDYFYFDADEDDRSLDDYKRIMKQCGLTITKVEGNNREAFIYYRGSSSAEQKAAKMLGISLEDSIKESKVKDAGLKTYKTLDYYAENGYYKVYVKNRNKNGDQPIKHLAESLGLKTSPQGYFTKDRVYAPPYAKEYLVEGTNKDAIIKFCETLDPKLVPLKGHIKDADANIVDKLIAEEEKAVMDYKEALMADSDLSANAVYAHILAEELEHLRELRSLKEQPSSGDSIKDAVKKINDPSAIEKELQKNLKNPDIEYAGDAYDESDLPIAIYGDSTRKTATDIAKYLKSKGYTGVVIDHEGSDYFATVHA